MLDLGIRSLQHGGRFSFGVPLAAWYYGPFIRLLNTVPAETLAMINRILNHAARTQVTKGSNRNPGIPGTIPEGFELDIPGIGPRRYVGDGNVWIWYRGSGVGPYPCMSALLAVERFADHLIGTLDLPVDKVIHALLRDCENLAMPGLVMGLLIRHLEKASGLLDPWLSQPWVWTLENARAASEGRLHVQGRDPDTTAGSDRRHIGPREVAAQLTLHAIGTGDQARLGALAAVADQLIANAHTETAGDPEAGEWVSVVEGWASFFRPANYHQRRDSDGTSFVQYEPPAHVVEALAPTNAELQAGNQALRLQLTYTNYLDDDDRQALSSLNADITLARQLAENPPEYGPLHPRDPVAAVAAAAVIGHSLGHVIVGDDDLRWAADTLLAAAADPHVDAFSHTTTIYPMAADRAAAKALPALLLASLEHLQTDPTRIDESLTALATSRFDEVRTALITGCALVWDAQCVTGAEPGAACGRHRPLWEAVRAGIGECRLGPWDQQSQSRTTHRLPEPYTDTLASVPARDLLVNRLTMPIACTADARTAQCVSSQAAALLPVLLDAHRRAAGHWAAEGYGGYPEAQRETVARVLISLTLEGEDEPLAKHLDAFAANANALQQLLTDLTALFTYDSELRPALAAVWPLVLRTTLDAVDAGADLHRNHQWGDYAIGALLPTPHLAPSDPDMDATLAAARASWITPDHLNGFLDRWTSLATGEPKAADAIAQYAMTTPITWQTTIGLDRLEQIINNRYDQFANRCWYVAGWLNDLREVTGSAGQMPSGWQRIVDGLAAAGDSQAVGLQQIDE